jgi:hypothetical protein
MCTQCLISKRSDCKFTGWRTSCPPCTKGKRPKCTFLLKPDLRRAQKNLLAAAVRGNHIGLFSFINLCHSVSDLNLFLDLSAALNEATQLSRLYSAQVALSVGLGVSVSNAARRAAQLARKAFEIEGEQFSSDANDSLIDDIASLISVVESPSLDYATILHQEYLAGFPSSTTPDVGDVTMGPPPSSSTEVPRPGPSSQRTGFASPFIRPSRFEEPKSPSPQSPPHKRARQGSTVGTAAPFITGQGRVVPRLLPPPLTAPPALPSGLPASFVSAAETAHLVSAPRLGTSRSSNAEASGSGVRPRRSTTSLRHSQSLEDSSSVVRRSKRNKKTK